MPLTPKAQKLLNEFAAESGEFTLFGLMANPATGELATFCSHSVEAGHVLSFLSRGINMLLEAAADGSLEGLDGEAEARKAKEELAASAVGGTYVH